MATIREAIILNVVAALGVASVTLPGGGTLNKPSGLTVHRFRARPLADSQLPSVAVYALNEQTERLTHGGTVKRTLTIRAECRAKTKTQAADEVQDPVLNWVVASVLDDLTRGGNALDTVEVTTEWDAAEAEETMGRSAVDFAVLYLTQEANPSAGA